MNPPVPIFESETRNFDSLKEIISNKSSIKTPWYKETLTYKFFEERTNINVNGSVPSSETWGLALKEFRGIKSLTRQYNLPNPVAVLLNTGSVDPNKNNFRNPKGHLAKTIRLYEFLGKKLKEEGFDVVETLPLFKKYSGMSMAVSEWEWHPNYLGHYIYAKSIYDFLISNGIVNN